MASKRPQPTAPAEPKKGTSTEKKKPVESLIAENRKARHDYHVDETLEAGVVLRGTEVKSLRQGRIVLQDAFALFMKDELYLMNADIQPYAHGNVHNHEPKRSRKLLVHKHELERWSGKVREKGYTIVPLKIYWKNGRAKVLLGLAKGKKEFDRREDIRAREADRDVGRVMRRGRR